MNQNLQERKRFFRKNRFETKSGIEAVFVTVLENDQPAPVIFMIGGRMENFYLDGKHMLYPTELDLQPDFYAVEDGYDDDDDFYDDDDDEEDETFENGIL